MIKARKLEGKYFQLELPDGNIVDIPVRNLNADLLFKMGAVAENGLKLVDKDGKPKLRTGKDNEILDKEYLENLKNVYTQQKNLMKELVPDWDKYAEYLEPLMQDPNTAQELMNEIMNAKPLDPEENRDVKKKRPTQSNLHKSKSSSSKQVTRTKR